MPIPALYEKQVKSILKNLNDLRKFLVATEVYYTECSNFLKNAMDNAGVEYNPDTENLKMPFHDETLAYAYTHMITQLIQYKKMGEFLSAHLDEFDHQTAKQLSSVFDREESNHIRNKVINEIADNIESLVEEKQQVINLTREIEQTIHQLESRLRVYFN